MRTIKFRAWDKKSKTRVLNFSDYVSVDNDGDLYITGKADSDGLDIEVVEFTGLLDKNGKEIYEGDVLTDGETSFEVIFSNGSFCIYEAPDSSFAIHSSYIANNGIIVIGNIYENPELLHA